jgi:hypothetical protein
VIKKFTLKDLAKHNKQGPKNLFEHISVYPSKGEGFKVWRKTWPEGTYYTIREMKMFVSVLIGRGRGMEEHTGCFTETEK